MLLTRVSIQRPLFILMVISALLVLGGVSYSRLGVELWPSITFPYVVVSTVYPGASPDSVDSLVTRKIEDAVIGLNHVDYVQSFSVEGYSSVVIAFTEKANPDAAAIDVERKVNSIRGFLPRDIEAPTITKVDPNALPVINLAFSGTRPLDQLQALADDRIVPRLTAVSGVAQVTVSGGRTREILVKVDPDRLQARGVSLLQVTQALAQDNVNVPGGALEQAERQWDLRVDAAAPTPALLGDIVVAAAPSGPVYLRDVATIEEGFKKQTTYGRTNGRDSLVLAVVKQPGANTIQVTDAVKEALDELRTTLPPDVRLDIITDDSIFTRLSLADVQRNLLEAVVLTGLVLLVFLHTWRSTFIVLLAIPTSLVSTFSVMYFLGFSMNMMTMVALALTVGILVDDSIVVLENIFRHLQMGQDPRTAALEGRSEIGLAAIAITLVDVVVFTPVAFMSGIVGQYFKQFGLTIATATLFSLFVSFTLTPMLASRWLAGESGAPNAAPGTSDPGNSSPDAGPRPRGRSLDPLAHLGVVWEAGYRRLRRGYGRLLGWALRHRWTVVAVGVASFIGGIALVAFNLLGSDFVPETDQGLINITLEMPPGASLAATDRAVRTIESRLAQWPEVETYTAQIGSSSGPRYARIFVKLVDKRHRTRSAQDLVVQARSLAEGIPGAKLQAQLPSFVGQGLQTVQVRVEGYDEKTVRDLAAQVEQMVRSTPGLTGVVNSAAVGQPEMVVTVDRRRVADLGLSAGQVAATLRTAVAGSVVTQYRPAGEKGVDVRVLVAGVDVPNMDRIASIPLLNARGSIVRLGQVAEIREGAGPTRIDRRNRQRLITITADVEGRGLGDVSRELQEKLDTMMVPTGYQVTLGGATQYQNESFSQLYQALGLSIVLMYMLMVALYESMLYPFIVMLSLPLAVVGALGLLVVTGNTLNMLSLIGMIMLTGLVGKNAILLVDYTNTLRRRGMGRDEALLEAGPTRLRPILMTTLAMILAMTPLALRIGEGAELRAPMGVTVIGGLTTSTLLTLVLVPAVYTIFDDVQAWLGHKLGWRPAFSAPEQVPVMGRLPGVAGGADGEPS